MADRVYPKIAHSQEVIRKQVERKKLAEGTHARFLLTSTGLACFDKEDRDPEKRGTLAISLSVDPFANPRDPKSLRPEYRIRCNIILPVKNPDFPEHKEPKTAFICSRWGRALFPDQLPPVPVLNRGRGGWDVMRWNDDKGAMEPVLGVEDQKPIFIPYKDEALKQEYDFRADLKAVEIFTDMFNDEALRNKVLKGCVFYATVRSQGGFTGLEDPSSTMLPGKQYGPVPVD